MRQNHHPAPSPFDVDTQLLGMAIVLVLVCLAGMIALAGLAWSGPKDADFYRKKATDAAARSNWKDSIFALETLVAVEPNNRSHQWDLAMAYKKSGVTSSFQSICAELAPPDRPGFGPAQRFTAQQILERLERSPPENQADQNNLLWQVIAHLRHSLADQPSHPEGVERLVDLLLALEDYSGAQQIMKTLPEATTTPSVKARMAWVNREDPNAMSLEKVHILASTLESAAAKAHAQDSVRRAHADACEIRGNIAASASIWIQLFNSSKAEFRKTEARRHLASLHTRRADEFFNRLPRDYGGMADAVYRGLAINPSDSALLERLVKLANPAERRLDAPEDMETRAKAQARLAGLLAKGTAPSLLHMLLGMEYHKTSRQDMARLHFELSYRTDPRSMEIANNLAWYLAHTHPRDPERALILANAAVQRQPDRANYLETRGQILALMGQYKEAVTDLETAARAMGSTRAIHSTLAECYARLGETVLATRHLALAKQSK